MNEKKGNISVYSQHRACPCSSMLWLWVVAGMCLCLPCSSVPACTVIGPCRCGGRHACACAVCPCPCLPIFFCACTFCHPSPFICARLHLFAGPCLSLAVCVCSVVTVPTTWLCLFGFCSCSHQACVLVGVCLDLFVLVRPLFALIWACLCLMGLRVRGREWIDGKKQVAN